MSGRGQGSRDPVPPSGLLRLPAVGRTPQGARGLSMCSVEVSLPSRWGGKGGMQGGPGAAHGRASRVS